MHCVRLMIVAIYMAHVDHMSKLGVHASSLNCHQIRWFVSFNFFAEMFKLVPLLDQACAANVWDPDAHTLLCFNWIKFS